MHTNEREWLNFNSRPLASIRGFKNSFTHGKSDLHRCTQGWARRRTLARLINLIIVAFIALQSCFGPLTKDDYGDFGRLEGGFL